MKKIKKKILGEFLDDERIRLFLAQTTNNSQISSFHSLEKAYRGMIPENFSTFVQFFIDAGNDINGTNQYGNTFLQSIRTHKQATQYCNALEKYGAK